MAGRAMANVKENPAQPVPIEERIRLRAYEIYVDRDCREGSAVDDWLTAEAEIRGTATVGKSTTR